MAADFCIEAEMKEISLTQGKSTIVDDEDYEMLVESSGWWAVNLNGNYYAQGYKYGKNIYMHRYLLKPPEGMQVDHKNRNGLDNRRDNLRLATHGQNLANSKTHSMSGFKGVEKNKYRFYAQISIDGKCKKLGGYDTPEEAARAYDVAALEQFGEFARINFPEG